MQSTALLTRLQAAPIYFQRKGRGRFKAAPQDIVKAALAGQEKRRQRDAQIEAHAQAMVAGELPAPIGAIAAELLVRPDKQSIEWKALEQAGAATGKAPERLLFDLGAFASPLELHRQRFLVEMFPSGAKAPVVPDWREQTGFDARLAALPLAPAAAFSIDDSATTEVDDAFSLQRLGDGRLRVGVHIAVPAMVAEPDGAIDQIARERMSTVYLPGDKITMLDEAFVAAFSLDAGKEVPALSIYFELDEAGESVVQVDSLLERVAIVDNLRHDQLDDLVTEAALADPAIEMPHGESLRLLWRLTLAQCLKREQFRGKPEPRFRGDFSFRFEGEQVFIEQRRRDTPLSRIVAEMAILANSSWGRMLAERDIAGIYRSQQAGRVRVSTQALPHEGLGVAQYMWATSPLRRYIDLINQRQLLAMVQDTAPPLNARSAELFSVIPSFDARYSAYQDFQQKMERYWCLHAGCQQPGRRLAAVAVRDETVRLAEAPLYLRPSGVPPMPPGQAMLIDVLDYSLLDLSVEARFVALAGEEESAVVEDA
ncbi:MAG: RNB domain-containing ribonuclease [Burkholderiaceae bacterium]